MVNTLLSDLGRRMDSVATFERAYRMKAQPWQVPYLQDQGDILILKGRQIGASTAVGAKAIHMAHYDPGSLAVIISKSQRHSTELTRRSRAALRNIERIRLDQDSATEIGLANGSRILSLPGKPTGVRGYTAKILVIDEAAFVEEETWVAARALVATGGQVIVQSTPNGAAGWFHDLWVNGGPRWHRYHIRSDEVATISKEFLAEELRSMGAYAFRAEYGAEFLEAGAGLFSGEVLRTLVEENARTYFA